jgi:hypothetical protein
MTPFDTTFGTALRVPLDATSWVEHVPGWLDNDGQLFDTLAALPGWAQRDRWIADQLRVEPRLTNEYPDVADAPVPLLREAAALLSARYGVPYDGLWLNFYRDHRDSTGWHGDWATCRRDECVVPVLSLGATRRFLVKPRQGGRSVVFTPAGGDLIVMGGRCQRDWRHSVPKENAPAGPRISVNFSSRWQAGQPAGRSD